MLAPFALRPALPASDGGSSRPRLLRGLRPTRDPRSATDLPTNRAGCPAGKGDRGWFPRSRCDRSIREAPSSTPAASPRLRRRPSARPPHRQNYTAWESTTCTMPASSCTADRRRSARFEPASRLRNFHHWFTHIAPSDLARRARTVWQYRHIPPSSGPLATLPGVPRVRLPPASIRPLRRPNGSGLSPPLDQHRASWRTVSSQRRPKAASADRWPGGALIDDHPVVRAGLRALIETEPDLVIARGATRIRPGRRWAPRSSPLNIVKAFGRGPTACSAAARRPPQHASQRGSALVPLLCSVRREAHPAG